MKVDRLELTKDSLLVQKRDDASHSLLDDALNFVQNYKYEAVGVAAIATLGGAAYALRSINRAASIENRILSNGVMNDALAQTEKRSADVLSFGEYNSRVAAGISKRELPTQAPKESVATMHDLFQARLGLNVPEQQRLTISNAFGHYMEGTNGNLAAETRMWIDAGQTLDRNASITEFARATLAATGKTYGFRSENFAAIVDAWKRNGVSLL